MERHDMNMYSIIIINPEIQSKTQYKQTWQSMQWIHNWHLFLLLLVRPIYLGMCPGVHLNTHTSIYEQAEVGSWKLMKN